MTRTKRVLTFLQGIILLSFAIVLVILREWGLPVVAAFFGISLTLRGLGTLTYYFRMARFMVGGKRVLYRGAIFLDFGVFTATLAKSRDSYIIFYIAVLNAFAGLVSILRARESRNMGSRLWKYEVLYGIYSLVSAAAVIIAEFVLHQTDIAMIVYAAGLAYSAVRRIASAFRRTAIVYIS